MTSVLFSQGIMTIREENETIDQHIQRHEKRVNENLEALEN